MRDISVMKSEKQVPHIFRNKFFLINLETLTLEYPQNGIVSHQACKMLFHYNPPHLLLCIPLSAYLGIFDLLQYLKLKKRSFSRYCNKDLAYSKHVLCFANLEFILIYPHAIAQLAAPSAI